MSRSGNSFENAVIKHFEGTLMGEYYHDATLDGIAALEAGVHDHIRSVTTSA